jgi:hypothetical protein
MQISNSVEWSVKGIAMQMSPFSLRAYIILLDSREYRIDPEVASDRHKSPC